MKASGKLLFVLLLLVTLSEFLVSDRASAQLSVGVSGLPPQTFDTAPLVSEWSTLSVGPVVAGGAITTGAQMDTVVQTNAAARVNLPLPTTNSTLPGVSGYAQWNSAGHYLQTRAQTNWYTLLMATLRNDTGSNVIALSLRYNLATAAGVTPVEEIPGHRVYYSFTGVTGTWIHIPAFDSTTAIDTSTKTVTLDSALWAPGSLLYMLWADANAVAAGPAEGPYTIDDFAVSASPVLDGPPVITAQPQSQTVNFPNQATFSAVANGSLPLFYQWFKGGARIGGATNSTFTINNATVTDQGSYSLLVSNSLGTATSSNAVLTVNCIGATPVLLTNQSLGQSLNSGGTINLSVGIFGSAPLVYQWYRSGLSISGATNSSYVRANAQAADSGLYFAIAANCSGSVTSYPVLVQVLEPPYTMVGLTNHFWRYNQSGTNLGTAWKEVNYDDSLWPSGRGILAQEDNSFIASLTNTVLSLTAGGAPVIAYYFRTTFVVSNEPGSVSLIASNYFDDGAVVYLNGAEAFRFNMPVGSPTNTMTAVAASPLGEGVPIVSNISPNLIIHGTNVLAVEVHQNTPTSSDVVFGLALLARNLPPGPPVIGTQSSDTVVFEGQDLTLSVTLALGPSSHFQWFKDGTALGGATTSALQLTNTSFAHAGRYWVTASNTYGAVTSSLVSVTVIGGEAKLRLLEFTNIWRFNQSGTDLGTAWTAPAYDDSTWQSARGVFATSSQGSFPEAINQALSLSDGLGTPITTYYFRVHFMLPLGVSNVVLWASNLLDDGAVFHVNGIAAGRIRMNGVVTAATFAEASPTSGLSYELLVLTPTNFVSGDNVLAVEVHQSTVNSPDVVFGMNLRGDAALNQPVTLLSPLPAQTVSEGTPATFTPNIFGGQPFVFQWFHNGLELAGETNEPLRIPVAHGIDAGNYFFIASNRMNAITSGVAILTITPDVIPPKAIMAFGTNGNSGVIVVFSEPVSPQSATNAANYSLSPSVNILSAHLVAPDRVLLITTGFNIQSNYTLSVANVFDRADSPNQILPSAVRIRPNRFPTPTGLLQVQTVFVILMADHSWPFIKGNTDRCPYIHSLLPFASYCENYTNPKNVYPTVPNYIWLEAGDEFGVKNDSGPLVNRIASTNHLVTQLFNAGIEWRGYIDSLPLGSVGIADAYPYLAWHNPLAFFDDVTSNYSYATNHIRPYDQFASDLAAGRIGRYNFIKPNATNDMYNSAPGNTRAAQGDYWLSHEIPLILNSAAYSNNGAIFITFDYSPNAAIPMIVLSPLAKGGGYASFVPYDHSSTLRTMQEIFGVRPYLGDAANASPLDDLFKTLSLYLVRTNGTFAVRLDNPLPGRTNYVQASSDLVNWTSINTNVATNSITILDPDAAAALQRFYRVIEQP